MDKNYYLDLVPSHLSVKPKYMAFLNEIIEVMETTASSTDSVNLAFTLSNAAGKQLDTIGEIVGVSRLLPINITTGNRELDDDEFRLLIQLKIARNMWDGTNKGANEVYKQVFGDRYTVNTVDNQNMSINIQFYGDVTTREAEIVSITDTLLVPAGVARSVTIVGDKLEVNMYAATAISSIDVRDSVQMINPIVTYTVSDIEDMDVSYLERKNVRVIEK